MLAAALVFVVSQTIDLQHHHDGDLSLEVDCQICLKLNSQNDSTLAKSNSLQVAHATIYFLTTVPDLFIRSNATHRPRGPPRSFS